MAEIPQEQYYWDDFQQADRSSWQIIIFYFGVVGLIAISIFSNLDFNKWEKITLVSILCSIGLLLGLFVRNHLIKYRFYALRDEGYLITHDCHMLLRTLLFELKPKDGECLKQMKVDNNLRKKFEKYKHPLSDPKVIKIDETHWEILDINDRYIFKKTSTLSNVYGESSYERRAKDRIRRDISPLKYLSDIVDKRGIGFQYVFWFIIIANVFFIIIGIGAPCYLLTNIFLPVFWFVVIMVAIIVVIFSYYIFKCKKFDKK